MLRQFKHGVVAAFLFLAGSLALGEVASAQEGSNPPPQGKITQEWVTQTLNQWPDVSKKAARATIEKYGLPNEATPSMFIWKNNGPWKRTIVYSEPVDHNFPKPHQDVLEQFIELKVPVEKFDELATYDGSVIVERTKGEISARCDKEEMNFLALNLAKDIIAGKKSVEEARRTYAQTAMAFMQGKSSPLTQSLQFEVAKGEADDPDRAIVKEVAQAGQ